ncbi:MAG: efflux RND transporter periplasmic adaptor subunit [Planctomycetota bacterium]|nr:efflux RND transporter periplasmic adaptor subunit [Planctomycetota bacterium]
MSAIRIVGVKGWAPVLAILILLPSATYMAGLRMSPGGGGESAPSTDNGDEPKVLYTCGMHPQILERKPGICPICQMKLTPMKLDGGEDDGASTGPQERKVLYWRAPMDPNYISEKPGKSPMGMDLVPVYADARETLSGPVIRIDPVTIQNMGIRTERVRRGPLVKIVRTLGRVDYDEPLVVFVDTKFGGWIEELYVDKTGQQVKRGQPLFAVYSPELYSAQQEFLSALRRLPKFEDSTSSTAYSDALANVEAGRRKLRFLDVSDDQIDRLAKSGKVEKNMTIHSPADGIVTEKMALRGMRVKPGMRLYTIADLTRVWVYLDIYEYQLPWIRVGQDATMTLPYVPGRIFRGKVVYIYPYLEKETRVIKARLEFDNPNLELKPEMYANVMLESRLRDDAILIPREAYIDSGTRKVVFVDRGDGKFDPRDIQVGVEGEGGRVEVLLGLEEGDVVVTSGQFMLDSESKLKEAVAKMLQAKRAPVKKAGASMAKAAGMDHAARAGQTEAQQAMTGPAIPSDAAYACPMDKHPDESDRVKQGAFFSGEPGECPWCGMKLKPIDQLQWVQAMKAAEGADVGYTCPKHDHVFSDRPGDCPRCGKKLEAFKVMYTCRDPVHAGEISTFSGDCPRCLDPLVAFRGPWLGEEMAQMNEPADAAPAESARYHCEAHPRVHSDEPGPCTICAQALVEAASVVAGDEPRKIPAGAKFVCPMEECWQFSETEDRCPTCGMKLKPIEDVPWAAELARSEVASSKFICPMHVNEGEQDQPGTCRLCAMQLVPVESIVGLGAGPEQIRRQIDFITEHYLALQTLLAADKTTDVARNALGLVGASEALVKLIGDGEEHERGALLAAARKLHVATLKIAGTDIASDRALFGEVSTAVRSMLNDVRPDQKRWPKLYIFHCPMSQADWIQTSEKKANPYYGFKMLDCGKLVETK